MGDKPGVFYGWVIVLISFVTLVLVMGTRFTFGIFYIAILEETGWSRAATAGIFSVSMLVYAVASLGVGVAFDRLGPRRLFPIAALILGCGYMLCSRIETLWQFYVFYGVVVGVGLTALGFVPHVSLVSRWFVRQRGMANSLALSGQGVGALALAPLTEVLIAQMGWRNSFLFYGILLPVVLLPLMWVWLRPSPQSMGLQPDGDATPPVVATPSPKPTAIPDGAAAGLYPQLLKNPAFWALFFIVFTLALNHMTLVVHQTAYLVDRGFQPEFAAWMLGISGILRSGGTIIWGTISDRATRESAFTLSALLGLVSVPFLLIASPGTGIWTVTVFVLLMGLGYGGINVVYAASAADLFQGPNFGKILGLLDVGFGLGAALGTYVAGYLFDRFQSYHLTFYGVMGMILVTIGCIWIAAPRRAQAQSRAAAS